MSYSNGYIPSSALGRIPGSNAGLLREAALAYTAMDAATSTSLAIYDGSVGRTYRSFARQLLAKRIYGSNAATPGSSNHGWALAVDLQTYGFAGSQRSAVDAVGGRFGWSKAWSDASWEPWHIKYRPGVWQPRPDPLRHLAAHQKQAATTLLYRRRRRAAEGRTGHGPRWRRWDQMVTRSYRKVERLHRRARDFDRKAILARVLADRDGMV